MVRTQIQFEEEQLATLRRIAAARKISVSAVVRDAVDRLAATDEKAARWKRALAAAGSVSGEPDLAESHDKYLDEAFGS